MNHDNKEEMKSRFRSALEHRKNTAPPSKKPKDKKTHKLITAQSDNRFYRRKSGG
jgi:hypothetical protein